MGTIPRSTFTRAFVRLNRLGEQNFQGWLFRRGMEFGARDKWWDDTGGSRPAPHEGLDFCCFADRDGHPVSLPVNVLVPAMYDGTVVKIFPDFLGYSVLVAHDFMGRGRSLHSIYAHTRPLDSLGAGSPLMEGEPLAVLSSGADRPMRPHLHLSVLWAPAAVAREIDWPNLHTLPGMVLCNPLDFIG